MASFLQVKIPDKKVNTMDCQRMPGEDQMLCGAPEDFLKMLLPAGQGERAGLLLF